MKLFLKIKYDGTAYSGYQAQPDAPSVQATLTKALSEGLGFPVTVTGCSRTDAGVHALGFCAAVEPEDKHEDWLKIPVGKVHRAVAHTLPEDIAIVGEAIVGDDFHPRYFAVEKEYIYRMYDSPASDPFLRDRAWHLKKPITEEGIARMNKAAGHIIGRRDFTSFMASGSKIVDATREVKSLTVERSGGEIILKISADGFLYNMVRIITGTLVECAEGRDPNSIPHLIAGRDRSLAGKTAPAYGLYLHRVEYPGNIEFKLY